MFDEFLVLLIAYKLKKLYGHGNGTGKEEFGHKQVDSDF